VNRLDKEEERLKIFSAYDYTCVKCGGSVYQYGTPMLAHLIADTKANRSKYGKAIIEDPLNRKPTCCLNCNDSQNIGNNPEECKKLIAEIIERRR